MMDQRFAYGLQLCFFLSDDEMDALEVDLLDWGCSPRDMTYDDWVVAGLDQRYEMTREDYERCFCEEVDISPYEEIVQADPVHIGAA